MQVGDVAEAHDCLGILRNQVVVDEWEHLDGPDPAPEAEDGIHLVIDQQRVQVIDPTLRRAGNVLLSGPDTVGQPYVEAPRLPPLNGTQDVTAVLEGT